MFCECVYLIILNIFKCYKQNNYKKKFMCDVNILKISVHVVADVHTSNIRDLSRYFPETSDLCTLFTFMFYLICIFQISKGHMCSDV